MDKVKCVEDGKVYRSKKETMEAYDLSYTELNKALRYGREVNGLHFHLMKDDVNDSEEDDGEKKRPKNIGCYSLDAVRMKRLHEIYETESKNSVAFVNNLIDAIEKRDAEWVTLRSRDFMTFTDEADEGKGPFAAACARGLFCYVILLIMYINAGKKLQPTLEEWLDDAKRMGSEAFLEILEDFGESFEQAEREHPLEENPFGFCDKYNCYRAWSMFSACNGKARLATVKNFFRRVEMLDWSGDIQPSLLEQKEAEIELLKTELGELKTELAKSQKKLEMMQKMMAS